MKRMVRMKRVKKTPTNQILKMMEMELGRTFMVAPEQRMDPLSRSVIFVPSSHGSDSKVFKKSASVSGS